MVRIDDVLPSVLVLRPAVRACAFAAGAPIAEGEVRTFFVDGPARQLLRRDESTGSTQPVLDNVAAMDVWIAGGGRVRVTLRVASILLQVPDFVLALDMSAPNLRDAR